MMKTDFVLVEAATALCLSTVAGAAEPDHPMDGYVCYYTIEEYPGGIGYGNKIENDLLEKRKILGR